MVALSDSYFLTPEAYLQWESQNPLKHEYRNGEAYAMAGTTDLHNTIGLNLALHIRNHLRGTDCRIYFADVKLRLEQANCFYYPDLMVTCDPRDRETPTYKRFPKLIIEILSSSTEAFDRGDKFNDYQTLDTLQEYILVNTPHQRIETFRRHHEKQWYFQSYLPPQETFHLDTLNLTIPLSLVYENS